MRQQAIVRASAMRPSFGTAYSRSMSIPCRKPRGHLLLVRRVRSVISGKASRRREARRQPLRRKNDAPSPAADLA